MSKASLSADNSMRDECDKWFKRFENKSVHLFGRRDEDDYVKHGAFLSMRYVLWKTLSAIGYSPWNPQAARVREFWRCDSTESSLSNIGEGISLAKVLSPAAAEMEDCAESVRALGCWLLIHDLLRGMFTIYQEGLPRKHHKMSGSGFYTRCHGHANHSDFMFPSLPSPLCTPRLNFLSLLQFIMHFKRVSCVFEIA